MKEKPRLSLLVLLFCVLGAVAIPFGSRAAIDRQTAVAEAPPQTKRPQFVPGEILVRFRQDFASRVFRPDLTVMQSGSELHLQIERLGGPEIVAGLCLAHVAAADTARALEALRSLPEVLYAEPNFIRYAEAVPNDPRYSELWALKNTGQTGGTAGADIKAETAWDITTGDRNVVVAVIDQGIDINHSDLTNNIWRNPGEIPGNGIDDDGNGYVDDYNGFDFVHNDSSVYDGPGTNPDGSIIDQHGTHVAGTIGAAGNNSVGVVGVNWQVSLMSLKFLGPQGGTTADLLKALAYAKMMRDLWISSAGAHGANIRVTNNSYGGGGFSQAEFDAIQALGNSGILFVAAAGNSNLDNNLSPAYPASYDLPNVISVAATDAFDNLANFSNRGSRTVNLGAPGVSILSTSPGNSYALLSGTSMASPHVAGAAALVLAAHPSLSMTRLRAALIFGGDPTNALDQFTVSGRRLSLAGALQNATEVDTTPPGPVSDLHVVSQDGRTTQVAWTGTGDDGNSGSASLVEARYIDLSSGAEFLLGTLRPGPAGSQQSIEVNIPYRHTSGTIAVRTIDNAGNSHLSNEVIVSVINDVAEPYLISEGGAAALTTGGTRLHLNYDDAITFYNLPFSFPFFEGYASSVALSTNGALYLAGAPGTNDLPNLSSRLGSFQMVAGLWDDLDLRTTQRADADIYAVQPDANHIVFRWQGVPCNGNAATGQCAGGAPVNFEIELNRDGTIVTRYGDGNTQLHPVVGIGGGQPEPFPVSSHTSEAAPKDLTNAPAVTFSLRNAPKKADVQISTSGSPNPVLIGGTISYLLTVTNAGPDTAAGVAVSDTLAAGVAYVSCSTSQGSCQGPTQPKGQVKADLGHIANGASATLTIVVTAVTPPNPSPYYTNNAIVSSQTYDPNSFNGSAYDTSIYQPNPQPLTGITTLWCAEAHCLALTPDGSLLAWGSNFSGQLGDGTRVNHNPAFVTALPVVKAIGAGHTHSLAIKPNGSLWAWGGNSRGQVGDGSTTDRYLPVPVNGISNVKAAAGGNSHTIAVKNDGTVWTWGNNQQGQLGDDPSTRHVTPFQVPGLSSVIAVAAGISHSVALRSDGTVWAWGDNSQNQIGDGTTTTRTAPTLVGGLSAIIAIASDGNTTLALRGDGTVWAWGANNFGQIGDGTSVSRATAVQVSGLNGVTAIAAGLSHSLALRNDGSIWAWGQNFNGELGIGITAQQLAMTPVRTVILNQAIAIAAGGDCSYAIAPDGTVYAWGAGNSKPYPYQVDGFLPRQTLGMPSFGPDGGSFTAIQNVTVTLAGAQITPTAFSNGGTHTAALMSDGTVQSWGRNDYGQLGVGMLQGYATLPLVVSGLSDVVAVSAGFDYTLALKADGTVWGWGDNNGSLGDGIGSLRTLPAQAVGLTNIIAISAGVQHSLALRGDGTVWAFGHNGYGQLGDGTQTDRMTPVQVVGLTGVKQISAGGNRSLAVKTDGTVWGWGQFTGSSGQSSTPVPLAGLANIRSVSAGAFHCAAVDNDGAVWTWGSNQYGELGDGTNVAHGPAKVPGLSGMTAVGTGNETTMCLSSDGTVWTWGMSLYGQLGSGNNSSSYVPYHVSGPTGVTSIGMNAYHVGGLNPNGTLWLWGTGTYGQLGDGTTFDHYLPNQVSFYINGPVIHYTTNGADPNDEDPVIQSGASITVDRNTILKARALRTGFAPGPIKTASYEITLNPIDDARTFIRRQYLDFLSREPDQGGWDYWTSQITQCGLDAVCIHNQRIAVSAAFFIELEFQQTGSVVYRLYRAAYGALPGASTRANITYAQFIADRGQLVGGAGLPQSTIDLVNNFVQRADFKAEYPDAMTATQFVDHLFDKASLTGAANALLRQQEIDAMSNNGRTRAQVLLDVIEIQEFKDREYKPSFVLMQYFGYLRRDPDQLGYDFWLNILNNRLPNDPSGYRAMVCAFLTSTEYQFRFGTTITRSNQDCSQ